ncbi:MAG: N-acetylmuramoyl-L-alanine amidase [Cardiobacteriaceae bacterium]|nr:N-acetylmuramoyl-L-alanine amidase [Cardiobacteriaceae bacterium]
MVRLSRALACLAFWLMSMTLWAQTPASLDNVRVNALGDKIQVVLDLSRPTEFQQFSLADPPRIVLDIPNTQRLTKRTGLTVKQGALYSIRTGFRPDNVLRVVLDLQYMARANVYTMPAETGKPARIVIDVFNQELPATLTQASHDGLPVAVGRVGSEQSTQVPSLPNFGAGTAFAPSVTLERHVSAQGVLEQQSALVQPPRSHQSILVVLDAGHGGKDPGAPSPDIRGLYEKKVALEITKRIKAHLERTPNIRVDLTRKTDVYLGLRQRMQIARQKGADIFVSIHADAVNNPNPRGASVYILSTKAASSEIANYLANNENASELKWGVDVGKYDDELQEMLLNIQQGGTLESSLLLAERVVSELAQVSRMHKKTVERANFMVLRSPDIPSILIETGFISNYQDAKLLSSKEHQEKLAQAIAQGIVRYFQENLPQHMLLVR